MPLVVVEPAQVALGHCLVHVALRTPRLDLHVKYGVRVVPVARADAHQVR